MMHTNKMILVPHENREQATATNSLLESLDNEMSKVLANKSLPVDAKLVEYNQLLHRYHKIYKEQMSPLHFDIIEERTEKDMKQPQEQLQQQHKISITEPVVSSSLHDDIRESILTLVQPRYHKNADLILKYVKKNPNIKWSDTGEMIINNNKIIGSNIIDLISDLTRQKKKESKPVIGADIFIKALIADNFPRESIVNKHRLSLLDSSSSSSNVYATPKGIDLQTPPPLSTIHKDPSVTPKHKKSVKKVSNINWATLKQ